MKNRQPASGLDSEDNTPILRFSRLARRVKFRVEEKFADSIITRVISSRSLRRAARRARTFFLVAADITRNPGVVLVAASQKLIEIFRERDGVCASHAKSHGRARPVARPSRDPSAGVVRGVDVSHFRRRRPARAIDHGPSATGTRPPVVCVCMQQPPSPPPTTTSAAGARRWTTRRPLPIRAPARACSATASTTATSFSNLSARGVRPGVPRASSRDDVRVAVKKVELAGMDADACADTRNEVAILAVSPPMSSAIMRPASSAASPHCHGVRLRGDLAARLRGDPTEHTETASCSSCADMPAVRLSRPGVLPRLEDRQHLRRGRLSSSSATGVSRCSPAGFCSTVCSSPST